MSEYETYTSRDGYSYQELHSQLTERLKMMKWLKDPRRITHIPINHEKYKDEKVGALWRNKKTGEWYPKYGKNESFIMGTWMLYMILHGRKIENLAHFILYFFFECIKNNESSFSVIQKKDVKVFYDISHEILESEYRKKWIKQVGTGNSYSSTDFTFLCKELLFDRKYKFIFDVHMELTVSQTIDEAIRTFEKYIHICEMRLYK